MTSRIELARHRALDHWFADGAVELALGMLLLGTAGVVVAQSWFPGSIAALLLVVWVVVGTWTARRWITAKKALQAGSGGYVSFGPPARRPIARLAVAAAVVAAVSMAALAQTAQAATASAGALLVGALLLMWIQTKRRRIGLVFVVGSLAWIQALLAADRYPLNIAMMLAVTGLALLIMALRARLSGLDRSAGARSRA
ncbi:MAG TPA: hypothetical protein VFO19_14855 [Vicinamibacterales bacterium]|nr:hypothetical protein [Vicinamibacterales bacterium]